MRRFSQIIVFILINALGFFMAPLCYVIGVGTGAISSADPAFDPAALNALFTNIMMTWLICAIFSLASFFLKGPARGFFLAAPVIFPLGYGLRLLFLPL